MRLLCGLLLGHLETFLEVSPESSDIFGRERAQDAVTVLRNVAGDIGLRTEHKMIQ